MRRAVVPLLALAVLAAVVIGLVQASGGQEKEHLPPYDIDRALAQLEGSPAPLAALHAQHSRLLPGGTAAYKARLKALRGYPVVVNKWGSWCNPCRQEFPFFERAATTFGRRVAFVGINTVDNAGEARSFLAERPLPFPSYEDPRGAVSQAAGLAGGAPITLFIGADGKPAFTHQGQYTSYAALRDDIRRYLRA